MGNKTFRNYYLLSLLGIFLLSLYPIYMGVSVVADVIRYGTVYAENYPKYIIPYTPISVSLVIGVALIPFLMKHFKKYALLFATSVSTVLFFVSELILERMVIVTRTVTEYVCTLENWQMYMCYIPPNSFAERTWTEVDVLMGEYSPMFKLHFYIISVVIIFTILNCFYGFAKMITDADNSRLKPLVIQTVVSSVFLGMCIWACFTALYRKGEITVSFLSAVLMCVFFVLMGVTVGVYVASFTFRKRMFFSVILPSLTAATITLLMYVGEMILLSGNLYRFGTGFLFDAIKVIVLAPVDILVIIASATITAIISNAIRDKNKISFA